MKCFAVSLLAIAVSSSVLAQQPVESNNRDAAVPVNNGLNSSSEILGRDDVVGISVYDSPELTHNVRVNADGDIRLPMVKQRIRAAGLTPPALENAIATALIDEQVLVNPIVTVTVVEYHSRPITIIGAVRSPTTLQFAGRITLLEAILKAGGLSDTAGSEIEVSRPATSTNSTAVAMTERVPVRSLMDGSDPAANIALDGGEYIRVLEAGRILVVGNVKRPGPLQITGGSQTSVLKAVILAGGLESFTSRKAYIYRVEPGSGNKNQIPIEVKKIMTLKAPDVPLYADDMLYVPNATGQQISAKALSISLGVGLGVAGLLIYLLH